MSAKDELLAIFKEEIALHEKLLELAENKRQAIITGKIVAMEETLLVEYETVERLNLLETQRKEKMATLAAEVKLSAVPATVRQLLAHLPQGDERDKLNAAREKLRVVLEKVQLKTRQNAELLKASMEHVSAFLQMLAQSGEVKSYNRQGKLERAPARFLDRSA